MSRKDDQYDPFSGYRPDMDQYGNVNEEVDAAYRMLGNIIIVVVLAIVGGVVFALTKFF